jgi:hypothetical protein
MSDSPAPIAWSPVSVVFMRSGRLIAHALLPADHSSSRLGAVPDRRQMWRRKPPVRWQRRGRRKEFDSSRAVFSF